MHCIEQFASAAELGEHGGLIGPRINATVQPMNQTIAALRIENVHRTEHFAGGGEVDLGRIIHTAAAVRLHVTAIGATGKNPRGLTFADDRAGGIRDLMAMPSLAPIDASLRTEKAAMHIGGVAGVTKLANDLLANIGDVVAVGIAKPPDRSRRRNIQPAIVPERSLRKRELVGKDRSLVEHAIGIRIGQQHDAVRQFLFEFLTLQIATGIFGHEQSASIVEAGHDGMLDERRLGGEGDFETIGDGDGLYAWIDVYLCQKTWGPSSSRRFCVELFDQLLNLLFQPHPPAIPGAENRTGRYQQQK